MTPCTRDTCDCFRLIHLSLDCDTHSLSHSCYDKAGALSLFKRVSLAVCGKCPCPMLPLNDNKNKLDPGAQALWLLPVASSHPSVVFTAFSALTSCTLSPCPCGFCSSLQNLIVHRTNSKLCPLRSRRSSEAWSFTSLTMSKRGLELADTTPVASHLCVRGLHNRWFSNLLIICQLHGK